MCPGTCFGLPGQGSAARVSCGGKLALMMAPQTGSERRTLRRPLPCPQENRRPRLGRLHEFYAFRSQLSAVPRALRVASRAFCR